MNLFITQAFLSKFYYIAGSILILLSAIRYVYLYVRDNDTSIKIVQQLATVHLPYIYKTLAVVAKKLDAEIEEPPVLILGIDKNK